MIRAGRLTKRIVFYRAPEKRDSFGAHDKDQVVVGKAWARKVDEPQSKELSTTAEGPVFSRQRSTFEVRYRNDLNTTMWIEFGGDQWDIEGIEDIGERDGLSLRCVVRNRGSASPNG